MASLVTEAHKKNKILHSMIHRKFQEHQRLPEGVKPYNISYYMINFSYCYSYTEWYI